MPRSMSLNSSPGAPALPSARQAFFLCLLLFFATALSFVDRQILSVLAPRITEEFGMSNAAYGRVLSAFVISYTVMTAFGGRLMDVLGTRLGLSLAVAFWSLASALHAVIGGIVGLALARFALGVGEGPCFPAAAKGAIEWVPVKRRALAVGFATGGSAFGAVLAPPLTVWFAKAFGWRGAFAASAILGLVWLILWQVAFWRMPSRPPAVARPSGSGFLQLIAQAEVRRLLVARFLFDPVFYFYMFWIPQYLAHERGLSLAQIGELTWIPYLVLGLTTIFAGRLSDAGVARGLAPTRARLALMLFAALITPVSCFVVGAQTTAIAIALIAVFMFAHGFWISNFITLIGDTVSAEDVGTTVGLTGTCGGIAAMGTNLLIGWAVDHFSYAPVFAVAAVLYPLAWVVIVSSRSRRREAPTPVATEPSLVPVANRPTED